MIFTFEVTKTYLENTNHPITIRAEHHPKLIEEIYNGAGNKTIPISIIPPKGRTLNGEIYCGTNNWGIYYQIKSLGEYPGYYLGNLNIGDIVYVKIKRIDDKVTVIISPAKVLAEKLLQQN